MDQRQILEERMKEIRIKEKEKEIQIKAQGLGLPYIYLEKFPISSDAISLIPEEQARQFQIVCFYRGIKEVRVGAVSPLSQEVQDLIKNLEKQHHFSVVLYWISEFSFEQALKLYAMLPKVRKIVSGVEITEADLNKAMVEIKTFSDFKDKVSGANVSEVLSVLISGAIKFRASDIHFEAAEDQANIRYRIDGVLQDITFLSREIFPRLISRIKLLSGLKINIEDQPQDGRFTIFLSDDRIDTRVSIIPSAYGESVVMRILAASAETIAFEDLGLRGQAFEALLAEIKRPTGMILTSGPTGSGKTTTLYAILNKLNDPEVKIITIEDPIEYRISNVTQTQVDSEKSYGFVTALQSLLRHDPDIILLGEIRDSQTASTAIQAALTGHLVLSTVHANNAAATIPRLFSLGAEASSIAPAINVVFAQRLVRRICVDCKEEVELSPKILERVKQILASLPQNPLQSAKSAQFYKGKGCPKCMGFGYHGRIGIFEVIPLNQKIKEYILKAKVSEYEIQKLAQEQGMLSMVQDGLLKALEGITTVEEVFRVTE